MQRIDVRMSDEEFKELTRQADKNKRTTAAILVKVAPSLKMNIDAKVSVKS